MRLNLSKHHAEGDFELNIASIIDCFTVLIAYLLVASSFISLGAYDVSVAVSSDSAPAPETEPKPSLTLRLQADRTFKVSLMGGPAGVSHDPVMLAAGTDGGWDFNGAESTVTEMKGRYPAMEEATITADPSVEYVDMVRAVERARKQLPKVFVGD